MARRQPSDYRFESEIQADILQEFGAVKYMRIHRNNVGKAYPVSQLPLIRAGKSVRPVTFGVKGSADILGIIAGSGRMIAIEVKMPGEKLRPEQVTWRDMFIRFGGLYVLANCVQDVYDRLAEEGVSCK